MDASLFNSLPRPAPAPAPAPASVPPAEVSAVANLAPAILPFTRLTANVKGSYTHELGPVTVFVGPNRRGKTARLDAIRLALSGQHSVGPHATNLWELAPPDAGELHASLTGPSGGLSFLMRTERGKAKKPGPPEPTGLFRSFSVQDFARMFPMSEAGLLEKGTTLTRENIFRRWGSVAAVPTPMGLNEAQLAVWKEEAAKVAAAFPRADPAAQLAELGGALRRLKLRLGDQISTAAATLQNAGVPVTVQGELLPELQRDLKLAMAWEAGESFRARLSGPLTQQNEQHNQKVATYNAERAVFDAWREGRAAEGLRLRQGINNAAQQREDLRQQLVAEVELQHSGQHWKKAVDVAVAEAQAAGSRTAPCLLCSNPHFEPAAAAAQILPRILARQASVERVRLQLSQADANLREAEAAVRNWEQPEAEKSRQLTARANELQRSYESLQAAMTECQKGLQMVTTGLPPGYSRPADAPTSAQLRIEIQNIERARMAQHLLEEQARTKHELEEKRDRVKLLENEAEVLLTQCLQATEAGAVAAINRYMPRGFEVRLHLDRCEWQVVGRDGRPHGREVMSGSEFGALTVAFVCAYTEGAPARYLVLDDADLHPFDPENLRDFLQMLQAAVQEGQLTQVFLAWSRPAEIPPGCTIIDLTA